MIEELVSPPQCIGSHFYVFISLLMLFAIMAFMEAPVYAYTDHRPHVVRLYTMDNCHWCDKVKDVMTSQGVDITPDYKVNESYEADGFPTVIYSDGFKDNGGRVLKGQVQWSNQPITVYYYTEEKDADAEIFVERKGSSWKDRLGRWIRWR